MAFRSRALISRVALCFLAVAAFPDGLCASATVCVKLKADGSGGANELQFTSAAQITDRQGTFALGDPVAGVFGSSGRLFLGDGANLRIVVFSREGEPVGRFGGRGRGVGRFLQISSMAAIAENRLGVVDHVRGVFSIWRDSGELVAEQPLGEDMFHVRGMRNLDSQNLILLEEAGSPGARSWVVSTRERSSLSLRSKSADLLSIFERGSGLAQPLFLLDPGEFAVFKEVLLFAPRYYEGRLYRFVREQGSGVWGGPMVIDGCQPSSDAVHAVSFDTPPSDEGPYAYYLRSVGVNGVNEVGVAHETLAVIPAVGGHFFHMATVLEDGRRFFVVQRIARDGQLDSVWIERTLTEEMAKLWPRPKVLASADGRRVVILKQVGHWLYPEVRIFETGLE